MYTPHTYPAALLMMLASMLCWGSWANTEKIDKTWRFELFYWDYIWGIVLCARPYTVYFVFALFVLGLVSISLAPVFG
jgi:glucose uptake protein